MIRVGVLYGGRSDEHDVSRCSAASVIKALDSSRYEAVAIGIDRSGRWHVQDKPVIIEDKNFGQVVALEKKGNWFLNHYEENGKLILYDAINGRRETVDIVFPAVHGSFCEDGTLQGLLELSMVPFVGAGSAGSSVGIDKDLAKKLLRDAGINVVPWITVDRHTWDNGPEAKLEEILNMLDLPFFVKPTCSGSSVGITKVKKPEQLKEAIDFSFEFDNRVIVEKAIDAREIECAVLGNHIPEVSVTGEIIPSHEFYSYDAKYIDKNGASLVIPADIDEKISKSIRQTAATAYAILKCSGMARVDFFIDKYSNEFFLNEINTLPGFTSISMYPKLWEYSGIEYSELINRLIDLGFERHKDMLRISNIRR